MLITPTKPEKAKMKKIIAYTSAAILLGAMMMLFPIHLLFVTRSEEGRYAYTLAQVDSSQEESMQKLREAYGLDAAKSQPTDPFVGTLALSFLVALVVYLLVRRRRPYSSYRYYPFLPLHS